MNIHALLNQGPVWMLAASLVSLPAQSEPRFNFDATPGSLPKDVVPSKYSLALDLDPAKESFNGVVDIAIDVRRPVSAIILSAFELTPGDVALIDGKRKRSLTVTENTAKREWRVGDDRTVAPGKYTLRIAYTGVVHAYGDGLYAVSYTAEGKPAKMLATQLEPIAARTVFPGFDEPSFRASFAITVTAPAAYEVVSNMPVRRREPEGTTVRWQFAPTPPMASYLVSVTVGQFDALEDSVDGVPLRILTAKGKKDEARYALTVTKQILPFYREYFGVPFTLPKLDQLAIPGVRGGAMEDWGAISYNESLLLFDPEKSSIETKQYVFEVIAHEVSHQWFGDLVTAASWDEIWLNEAFATWMERKATARFNPDWQIPLTHVLWRQGVMRRDAGPSTRAIRSGPVVQTAVYDVFDGVTYVKGGAVLDMLETYIGPDVFRRGLQAYFVGQKLSNATAGDLWFYLAKASGKDIGAIARSWIDQEGYPLLQARVSCSADRQTLSLEQRRFRTDGKADSAALWKVPVAAASSSTKVVPILLADRQASFVTGPCTATPLYVDSSAGFFHMQYPPEHFTRLARAFPELPTSERMALLTDTLALAQAEVLPLGDYFALVTQLRPSGDPATEVLYMQAINALFNLDNALAGTQAQTELRRFARGNLGPMLSKLGWNASKSETAVTLNLRKELIENLGRFGDEPTLRKSAELFAEERKNGSSIEPSIRPAVMANVARRADADVYTELVRRMMAADRVEDRELYASALGNVEDPELARRFLALSLEDKLPPDLASSLPGMLARLPAHGELAYTFTRDHFDALSLKQSEWGRAFLLPRAAATFNDAERARTLLSDQPRLVGEAGDKAAKEMAGDIELRSRIKSRNGASLDVGAPLASH